MLASKSYQTFCKTYKTYSECALIYHTLYGVIWIKILGSSPKTRHEQWELLYKRGLLEIESFIELHSRNVENFIQPLEKTSDTLILINDVHALYCYAYNIDSGETDVAAPDRGLISETVLKYTCAASHSSHLVFITLWIVCIPLLMLIECRVKINKVREETTCSHLACKLVKVIIRVLRKIAHPSLLFPYLNREDSSGSITHTLICAVKKLPDYTSAFCRSVCAVIN